MFCEETHRSAAVFCSVVLLGEGKSGGADVMGAAPPVSGPGVFLCGRRWREAALGGRRGGVAQARALQGEARGSAMVTVGAGSHLGHPLEIFRTEIGAAAEGEDVGEACEFAFDVSEAVRVADEEQHAALDAAGERDAQDGLEIETPIGEERGDARHGAGVILDAEFEHGGGRRRGCVRLRLVAVGRRSGRVWHGGGPALALLRWGKIKTPSAQARGGN